MGVKICFKCNVEKPLSDYYVHKKMGDGHLNKCKECTKQDVEIREIELRKNPDWIIQERKRGREKHHRLYSLNSPFKIDNEFKIKKQTAVEASAKRLLKQKEYRKKFPEKFKARQTVNKKTKSKKGFHFHHWSYNSQHYSDVIELSISDHSKLHRYMVYDQEQMMYRRTDNNELLDTKERHIEYFNLIKTKP